MHQQKSSVAHRENWKKRSEMGPCAFGVGPCPREQSRGHVAGMEKALRR